MSEGEEAEHTRLCPSPEEEDPAVVERDPQRRFHRYDEELARGRFKTVFRGYDTENGIDVAWCKVCGNSPDTLANLHQDMRKGLGLDHANIIRCFQCWLDERQGCINLITELFTSGTLRQYRQVYSNANVDVHRKYTRQILNGLIYLHSRTPPIVHADIRLDKIYVNGFNGEVKIGDLGLATLLAQRCQPSELPRRLDSPQSDLIALGVSVYELITGVHLDASIQSASLFDRALYLDKVKNADARDFIVQCWAKTESSTAASLMKHRFLKMKSSGFRVRNRAEWDQERVEAQNQGLGLMKLKGEDWSFEFQGYESDEDRGSLHIRLTMSNGAETEHLTKLDFDYNLETDTPESVGCDIADSFELSSTDREICKAGLREWLSVAVATSKANNSNKGKRDEAEASGAAEEDDDDDR